MLNAEFPHLLGRVSGLDDGVSRALYGGFCILESINRQLIEQDGEPILRFETLVVHSDGSLVAELEAVEHTDGVDELFEYVGDVLDYMGACVADYYHLNSKEENVLH